MPVTEPTHAAPAHASPPTPLPTNTATAHAGSLPINTATAHAGSLPTNKAPALALPTSNGLAIEGESTTDGQLTSARTKSGAGVCGVGNGGSGLVGFLVSGGGWGRGL